LSRIKRHIAHAFKAMIGDIAGRTTDAEVVLRWSALFFDIDVKGETEKEALEYKTRIARMQRGRDPVGYLIRCFEILTGVRLYKRSQKREIRKILTSILNLSGEEFTELWVRQSGKTETGAALILGCAVLLPLISLDPWWAAKFPKITLFGSRGFWSGIAGPKIEQARIPYRRIRKLFRKRRFKECLALLGIWLDENTKNNCVFSHGSEIHCLSAFHTVEEEGWTFDLMWMEESQDITEWSVAKVFRPMLLSTNGTMVFVGTAGIRDSYFYRLVTQRKNLYKHTLKAAIRDNPLYEKTAHKIIDEFGPDSTIVKITLYLEWVLEMGMLVSPTVFDRMRADGQNGRYHFRPGLFTPKKRRCYGIDWGKKGSDTCVVGGEVWDDHIRVIDLLRLEGTDYGDQYVIIKNWIRERGYGATVCDTTGTQEQAVDPMKKILPYVFPVIYSVQIKGSLLRKFRQLIPSEKTEYTPEIKRYLKAGEDFIDLFGDTFHRQGQRVSVIQYADYLPTDTEWRIFEKQMLRCETKLKGNIEVFEKPDARNLEKGEDPIKDDYIDAFMNFLKATEIPVWTDETGRYEMRGRRRR